MSSASSSPYGSPERPARHYHYSGSPFSDEESAALLLRPLAPRRNTPVLHAPDNGPLEDLPSGSYGGRAVASLVISPSDSAGTLDADVNVHGSEQSPTPLRVFLTLGTEASIFIHNARVAQPSPLPMRCIK